jgi:hypothetical protein
MKSDAFYFLLIGARGNFPLHLVFCFYRLPLFWFNPDKDSQLRSELREKPETGKSIGMPFFVILLVQI